MTSVIDSDIEPLIDNCSHFTLSQHRRAVLLGESGIVVSFSRTFSYPFHNNLTITFEDENGASVDFPAGAGRRQRRGRRRG